MDGAVTCLKWKDKRDVHMLSTFHSDTTVDKQRRTRSTAGGVETIQKPSMVDDYNQHMGGVDRSDQLVFTTATLTSQVVEECFSTWWTCVL